MRSAPPPMNIIPTVAYSSSRKYSGTRILSLPRYPSESSTVSSAPNRKIRSVMYRKLSSAIIASRPPARTPDTQKTTTTAAVSTSPTAARYPTSS